jgi:hypothetical protein
MHRDFDMLPVRALIFASSPRRTLILNQTAASGVAVLHSEISAN